VTDEFDDAPLDDEQWEEQVDERLRVQAILGGALFSAALVVLGGAVLYTLIRLASAPAYLAEEGAYVFNPDVGEVAPFNQRVAAFAAALGGARTQALIGAALLVTGLALLARRDRDLRHGVATLGSHVYRVVGAIGFLAAFYLRYITFKNAGGWSGKADEIAVGLTELAASAATVVLGAAALALLQRPRLR